MENSLPGSRKPHLVIKPGSGWQALNLREVWQYRDLLITLAMRDVMLRYRQTALGVVWVVLQPLMAAGIFSFVFGRVAKLSSDGVPYFVFSYAGLLAWNAFNSTLGKSSGALVGSAHLVSKVYFPRMVLPLATVIGTLIDFAVALVLMFVLLILYGLSPTMNLLTMPVWLLLILTMSLGIGLFASALTVSYRDVGYIVPVFVQILMYASPVAYASSALPKEVQGVYLLNPLAPLLEAFRWSVLGRGQFHAGYVAYAAVFSIAAFVFGAFAFKKMERSFADII